MRPVLLETPLLGKLLCVISFALLIVATSGSNVYPSPASLPHVSAPVPEMTEGHTHHVSPSTSIDSPSYGAAPPFNVEGNLPYLSPRKPKVSLPFKTASPPIFAHGDSPSMSPVASQKKEPVGKSSVSVVGAPAPIASPSRNLPKISPDTAISPVAESPLHSPVTHSTSIATPLRSPPAIQPSPPNALSPTIDERNVSNNVPILNPFAHAPTATPAKNASQSPPAINIGSPSAFSPSTNQRNTSNNEAPILEPIAPAPAATPPRNSIRSPPFINKPSSAPPSSNKGNISIHNAPISKPIASDISPTLPPPSINWKSTGKPVSSPPNETLRPLLPVNRSPGNGFTRKAMRHTNKNPLPHLSSPSSLPDTPYQSAAPSPSISFHKRQHARNIISSPAPVPSYMSSPHSKQGVVSPAFAPTHRQRYSAHPPLKPGSAVSQSHFPIPPSVIPAPSPVTTNMPLISPKVSLPRSSSRNPRMPLVPPLRAFPPPPPNEDCSATVCTDPYTNTPPGSPCGCVLPMQVGLRLSVALYTFFPLVSELAAEMASGVFMKQSQVRVIGANAASEQPEKTVVLIDLVPLGEKFDNTTAFLTFQRFWHKQVVINASLFGDYEVLYVRYSGLPPSPPLPPSSIGIMEDGPYSSNDNNARAIKPLGVDVQGKHHKNGLSGGIIAIIVLSASVAVVLCSAIVWVFVFRHRDHASQLAQTPRPLLPSLSKPPGSAGSIVGSGLSSASLSFGSSIVTYTGSAKTFSASDIEKATGNFDASRILGEGGFGRVYSGVLEDGTKVAVKVLKRDDQQGGREFLAEVEMLSRLHHRNLVKLIGICTEEHVRCLVYELIPNGSVESHLHGVDKEYAPLDWEARIKIALGAARGLAYLHEDSSPRVIHRDFKSSNILLENDFTPKVSDFGLARTAMDEENRHISTRVMGTFGYVAPEYAMTGHLLVKSDVYSYGVVLLELLTGRKPVDMSQPPGQENLVAWARPLLTRKEDLETIVDPSLGSDVPIDSVAKVAAIASMCVQPEVSHRPFMGEVVQALKLVCNECDEAKENPSRSSSQDDLSIDVDAGVSIGSRQFTDPQYSVRNYDSGPETERGLSASNLFSTSPRFGRQSPGSFRRHSSSGPLPTERNTNFWRRMKRLSSGSVSEHGTMFRFLPGSH